MPTIARLQYSMIWMFFQDHNPPHFHVRGLDGREVWVRISDLTVIKGEMDRRALTEALNWASANQQFLQETWNDFQN
jgi:hypothetical protein